MRYIWILRHDIKFSGHLPRCAVLVCMIGTKCSNRLTCKYTLSILSISKLIETSRMLMAIHKNAHTPLSIVTWVQSSIFIIKSREMKHTTFLLLQQANFKEVLRVCWQCGNDQRKHPHVLCVIYNYRGMRPCIKNLPLWYWSKPFNWEVPLQRFTPVVKFPVNGKERADQSTNVVWYNMHKNGQA